MLSTWKRSSAFRRQRLIRRLVVAPLLLAAAVLACATVAALLEQPVWAAAVGAGLVVVYWGLEALTWHRARDREGLALGVAIGGMFTRLVVMLAALVAIGLLARPAFASAALSFLATLTLYMAIRGFTYDEASRPADHAGLR